MENSSIILKCLLSVGVFVEIEGEGEVEISFSGAICVKHSSSFCAIPLRDSRRCS